MGRTKFRRLSNDDVFARWQERFDRIHTELMYVFSNRRKFLDLMDMFKNSEKLYAIGSQPYEWIVGHWGRDAAMAVRRELDGDRNTISFGALLDEMAERNNVLTRTRFFAQLKNADKFIIKVNNELFDSYGVVSRTNDPVDDYMKSDGIKADRDTLDTVASSVLAYASKIIAHRAPVNKVSLKVKEIHAALEAMEVVFKKYHVILTGKALTELEPTNVGDDWKEVFTFPWYIPRNR